MILSKKKIISLCSSILLFGALSSCKKDKLINPCNSEITQEILFLEKIDKGVFGYNGNEQLVFKNFFTEEEIIFLPRQDSIIVDPNLKESSISYSCGEETIELFFLYQEARMSFIGNNDYLLNLYLRPEPLFFDGLKKPVFIDVLTVEINKPIYNNSGSLNFVATCQTKQIISFKGQEKDSTSIVDHYYLEQGVDPINSMKVGNRTYSNTFISKCNNIKEVTTASENGMVSFRDEFGELWVFDRKFVQTNTFLVDIALPDSNGNIIQFSSLQENIKLIYFWASWSVPSRNENINTLNTLYNSRNQQGFQIYGISLDEDRSNWLSAINEDNIQWINVNDNSGLNSTLLKDLRVETIPFTILLDANGEIIASGLLGADLVQEVERFFQ